VRPGAEGVDLTAVRSSGKGLVRFVARTPDGRPVVGAKFRVDTGEWDDKATGVSDAEGHVRIEDVAKCRCRVYVSDQPDDPAPWAELGAMPPAVEFRPRVDGDETVVEFRAAAAIRGTVSLPEGFVTTDAQSRPMVHAQEPGSNERLGSAWAAADGKFTLC